MKSMRKTALFLVLTFSFWLVAVHAHGQQQTPPAAEQDNLVQPYRLDFSFNEIEDGKTINTRHYSLNVTPDGGDEIKIGTRVPVASFENAGDSSQKSYQYIDIGTNISARLEKAHGDLRLSVEAAISNIEKVEGQPSLLPVIRQMRFGEQRTLLVLDKPIIIGIVDDPSSKKQFQLEVTVTKVR